MRKQRRAALQAREAGRRALAHASARLNALRSIVGLREKTLSRSAPLGSNPDWASRADPRTLLHRVALPAGAPSLHTMMPSDSTATSRPFGSAFSSPIHRARSLGRTPEVRPSVATQPPSGATGKPLAARAAQPQYRPRRNRRSRRSRGMEAMPRSASERIPQ